MLVKDILKNKGGSVFSITADRTVQDAVDLLVEKNIGALLVLEGERIVGIITERDVLREASRQKGRLGERRVSEVMTKEVVVGAPDDRVKAVQHLMIERRIRHLPIVDQGKVAGIISIGDAMKVILDASEAENYDLRKFVVEKNVI